LQKLSDTDPSICPACDAPHLRRMVSAPSFRLAGSGWYETDFKKDGDKKRNLAEGSHSSHSSHGSDAAKPATASPAPAAAAAKAASSD
ncbi:MAG TPA: zinc ribbon domain-containing protein, partial [Rhodanobacter sp.]|nr:zinc ribbon domain-containing protein [Rhodanobacter sp.]